MQAGWEIRFIRNKCLNMKGWFKNVDVLKCGKNSLVGWINGRICCHWLRGDLLFGNLVRLLSCSMFSWFSIADGGLDFEYNEWPRFIWWCLRCIMLLESQEACKVCMLVFGSIIFNVRCRVSLEDFGIYIIFYWLSIISSYKGSRFD